ncbi:ribonuclease P protein component [Luminiphilus syltensis]|uniref:ribonuclease P protein component n=1 Tax=Luminiphilus syltensis TaxID=1341119 RepID=UPI0005913CA2|nr:ribonuclease P protein component [Luminiphilus syltensis]
MPTPSLHFPKSARLLTASQFTRVFERNSHRAGAKHALVLGSTNDLTQSRLGLVVAKKHVRLAHERNRVKRLVREHFRQHPLQTPLDVIFLARKGLAELSNREIETLLADLWNTLVSVRQ